MRWILALLPIATLAGELTLTWDDPNPPASPTNLHHWVNVYRRAVVGTNVAMVYLGSSSNGFFTATNVSPTTINSFVATCVNIVGESSPCLPLTLGPLLAVSNFISKTTWDIPPGKMLQRSYDLASWEDFIRPFNQTQTNRVRISQRSIGPKEFYRLADIPPMAAPPMP